MVATLRDEQLVKPSPLPWMHLRRCSGGEPAGVVIMIGHCAPISDRIRTCLLASRCGSYISESDTETFHPGRMCVVKPGIHPNYRRATVQCACGNTFETRSTTPAIHVEICARCHPYYTGKQKLLDTAGRVERFNKKYRTEKVAS